MTSCRGSEATGGRGGAVGPARDPARGRGRTPAGASRRRRGRRRPPRPRAGFTILELLVVLAIITLVGGLGAGAWQMARRNYALQATAGKVQGVLRAARNGALMTGIPTVAIVDPASRTVTAMGFEPVGEWSFDVAEGDALAALGLGGFTSHGAEMVEDGKPGRAVAFRNPPGARQGSWIDCGEEPRFDLRSSVRIEAWVRHDIPDLVRPPEEARSRSRSARSRRGEASDRDEPAAAIVERRGAYFLGLAPDGSLEGAIGDHRVRTEPGVVPAARWVRVGLLFDGKVLELEADGVPRSTSRVLADGSRAGDPAARVPEAVPAVQARLTISAEDRPFFGDIDEVRVSGGVEPLVYRLSDLEQIVGWKKILHFDRRGHLDPAYHSGDVRIVVVETPDEAGGGRSKTDVYVDYSLTFEEWLARWETPPPLRQEDEEQRLEGGFGDARSVAIQVDRLGVIR